MNLRTLSKRLLAFLLVGTILAPWPYILAIPQYAFAEPNTPATYGGASSGGATGGSTSSWGQAAASGAVSLSSCMAAAGLALGGSAGAIGALGGALSGAGSYLSGVFNDIFGGGSASSVLSDSDLKQQALNKALDAAVGGGAAEGASGAAGGLLPVPVVAPLTDTGIAAGNASREKIGAAQIGLQTSLVTIQLGIATKKNVFDCIAWAIAKMIWRSIAASVIDWINGGFNGKPAFLQNFDRFMLGIADNIAGQIIQGAGLGFLCSPFQLNIRIALATRYAQRAPQCTLTKAIANVQNFMKNFQQGGWGAWLQFTSAPQNNPYGGYLLGEATIALRTQDAQNGQAQQLSWGQGFLSLTGQKCKQVPVSVNGMRPQMTEQCTSDIQTPGELIAHKLGSTVDAPELSLLMANELNQIIDALSQQLILKALNGLFSLSQPTSYGDDYYRFSTQTTELSLQDTAGYGGSGASVDGTDTLLSQIDAAQSNERNLQNKLLEGLSLLDNTIKNSQNIKACWVDKAGSAYTSTASSQAQFTAIPNSGSVPLSVTFTVAPSSATSIDFGDGANAPTCNTSGCSTSVLHQYNLPGTYTARLLDAPSAATCPDGATCLAVATRVLASTIITIGGASTPLSQDERVRAASEASRIDTTLATLIDKRKQFSDGYNQSLLVSQSLQDMGARVTNVQTALELGNISQDFYTKQLSGVYTSSQVLDRMNTVLTQMRDDANNQYQVALTDMNMCKYFPNQPPYDASVQSTLFATPTYATAPASITINGLAETGSYVLDYGDNSTPLNVTCTTSCSLPVGFTKTHAYTTSGSYVVSLTSNNTPNAPYHKTVTTTITLQ